MSLGAGFFQQVSGGGLAGEQQDLAGRQNLPNADGGFNAVHVRHDYVADDEVRLTFARPVHGGAAGIYG